MTRNLDARPQAPPQSGGDPTSDDLVLQALGLGLRYGSRDAFRGITLGVRRGRVLALVGPSGCGKTSFLSCLNRMTDLLPRCAIEGQVRLNGQDIHAEGFDVVGLRRRVGMIFQRPNPFPMSIRRNLEFPLREHGVRDKDTLEGTLEAALSDVGLWGEVKDRLETSALALSGGHQQRLCLARALALKPSVLLMDEPCSALDPLSSGVVEDLIDGLRERYTVVVVTHNLAQARRLADEVAVFWFQEGCGRVIEHGPVDQIFGAPRSEVTAAYVNGMRG